MKEDARFERSTKSAPAPASIGNFNRSIRETYTCTYHEITRRPILSTQTGAQSQTRSLFECKCGKVFPSGAVTRAKCPSCGALCRVRSDVPDEIRDPRKTLTTTQKALELIAGRAGAGLGTELDAVFAKIFTDALKYLTPALEASFVQKGDDDELLNRLMGDDTDKHNALPAASEDPVQDLNDLFDEADEAAKGDTGDL